MTPSQFLVRGLLAGLIAGLAAFGVAYAVGEAQVDAAIAIEEAHADHSHDDEGAESGATEISRFNQSTWGLLTGTVAIGIAMGGITALAAAFAAGRVGNLKPAQTTALVALIGFVAVGLVPFLKYPATPPAVGNPDTIGDRTTFYFVMLGIAVVAAVAAMILAARLHRSGKSAFRATVIPALGFLAIVAVAAALLPTVNEVGAFPADTLWQFRLASILTTATLWAVIGIVLSGLVGRLYARVSADAARRDLAASL